MEDHLQLFNEPEIFCTNWKPLSSALMLISDIMLAKTVLIHCKEFLISQRRCQKYIEPEPEFLNS